MLLFDDYKRLEDAAGKDIAAAIAHALEQADTKWRQELATKADLENGLLLTRSEFKEQLVSAKHDLLRWMVGGFLAQTALLVAVIALFFK